MSDAALTPRSSALVSVPTQQELENLSPADLWTLEERATEVQEACREINDDRLRHWIEVEGKTQSEVARLIGRDQATVSRRCAACGIKSLSNRGRPIMQTHNSVGADDAEEVDAELVEDDEEYATSSQPFHGAPDPGPRVKCPTCGHMVVPTDIQTWKE